MAEQKPEIVMRYVGRGTFIPDVPARDLTDDDLAALKAVDDERAAAAEQAKQDAPARRDRRGLVKSGLYEPVVPAKKE